jgi:hypothetical protein
MLSITKPIIKKNLSHMNNSVILTFKSIEINIIDLNNEEEKGVKSKIHYPIYVPVQALPDLIQFNKHELELKIMENLTFDSERNQFKY